MSALTAISTSSFDDFLVERSLRLRRASRSLSSLREVTTTLEGLMPMGMVAPEPFSRWTRSTWMTHFLR